MHLYFLAARHSHVGNNEITGNEFQPIDVQQPRRSISTNKSNTELVKQESLMKMEVSFEDNALKAEDMIDDDSVQSGVDISITSPHSVGTRPSRTKKPTIRAAAWTQERMQAEARRGHARDKDHNTTYSNVEVAEGASTGGWTHDPNEPRYCVCNQVSYGEMVGCDNTKCALEWFHYECVNLTEAPKGKWFCPQCTQSMKRRNKNRSMTML